MNFKKAICLILLISIACFFAGCTKGKDILGNYHLIAEFNTGAFVEGYYPNSSQLKKSFKYGPFDVEFSAVYEENQITYTVENSSDDLIAERKTFDDIYNEYYESWNNYVSGSDIGTLNTYTEGTEKNINLIISGIRYDVSFFIDKDSQYIIYTIDN